jgi:hypothetical protein
MFLFADDTNALSMHDNLHYLIDFIIVELKKGVGIFFHVLHVYYSFHQKCSKLDTFTA